MAIELGPGPRHRFYDAVARWRDDSSDHNVVIDAAVQALVDDLDTPAVRLLAGLSAKLPRPEIESAVIDALDELRLPHLDAEGAPPRDYSSETYGSPRPARSTSQTRSYSNVNDALTVQRSAND